MTKENNCKDCMILHSPQNCPKKDLTTNCDKDNIKPLKESLSDKIELMDVERGDRYHPMVDVIYIKEKVKEAQDRLKEEINNSGAKNVVKDIRGNCLAGYGIEYRILFRIIDKIFLEVFGGKIVK